MRELSFGGSTASRPALGWLLAAAALAFAARSVEVDVARGLFGAQQDNANVVTTATLEPPASVQVVNPQPTALDVEWTPSPSAFTTGYQVYRSDGPGGPYVAVGGSVGAATFGISDGGLLPSTSYHYVVRALGSGWTSGDSMEAQGTTAP